MTTNNTDAETAEDGETYEEIDPNKQQEDIIESEDYPQRVLAGAGTGKTYTMVEKIRTLIEDENVPPERILALTFTNQAAESMREKLAESIGPKANDIDAYTYHSLAHDYLTEFGYYASFDPRSRLVGEVERTQLMYECLEELSYDFTSPGVSPPGTMYSQTEADLKSFITEAKSEGIQPAEIERYLPETERLATLAELPEQIQTDASELLRAETKPSSEADLETLISNIQEFSTCLAEYKESLETTPAEADIATYLDIFIAICDACITECRTREDAIINGDYQAFGRVPAYLFNTYSGKATGVAKVSTLPLERLETFIDELQTAHDLTVGYQAYERKLDENDLLDFDDLIIELEYLLRTNTQVRDWIANRWEYVFCDEFQDTDRIQFDLVEQLASQANLFVVGDDDQAIYEWRGANTSNIREHFTTTYPRFADFELEYNYRSRKPILDFADSALSELADRESEKELKPTEERAEADTGVAVFEQDDPGQEAGEIASVISALNTGDAPGVADSFDIGDVAILIRKNDHARPIRRALTQAGIPYELVGGLVSASIGVDTITAYLKVLVNPDDEVSLNRVLMMGYRLPEDDLIRLNKGDTPLWESMQTCEPANYSAPNALKRARTDLRELTAISRTLSLSSVYDAIKQRTRLDLFLREDERRELRYFDDVVENFDDSPIETELNEAFIEYLRYTATSVSEGSAPGDQPEVSDEVVTIMTVHKAKGLEFPVVFLPRLEANQWEPREGDFRQFISAFNPTEHPAEVDFVRRTRNEQQRVFHVAATRAEELLVLSGTTDGRSPAEKPVSTEAIQALYPETVEWDETATSFDIWGLVRDSLPDTTLEWTNHSWGGKVSQTVLRDGDQEYDYTQAVDKLCTLTQQALDGTLDPLRPADSPLDIPATAIDAVEPNIRQQFSYSAVDTFQQCSRWYYLDHIVHAIDDDSLTLRTNDETRSEPGTSTVSRRLVGTIFHETAAAATRQGSRDPERWRSIAKTKAGYRQQAGAQTLEEVSACIDRYLETEVADWDLIAAEKRFEVTLPIYTTAPTGETYPVIGAIDAIYRRGDGKYAVVDYKTGEKQSNYTLQQLLYILAANQFFGEELGEQDSDGTGLTVEYAGILDLGPDGPALDESRYTETELELQEHEIIEELSRAASATYDDPQPGKVDGEWVCKYCNHGSLPCNRYNH